MSALATQVLQQRPLVAIVGATGTGKSQLAVDIATRFNGEIINADAMQLYHGLPIITNKITDPERNGIRHHLLGNIGLEEPTWTVGRFVKNALKCIEDIHSRGKLPIVVGGTHYYTQALLFKYGVVHEHDAHGSDKKDSSFLTLQERDEAYPALEEDTTSLLARLREVDPVMAARWHPNDRRKIQRSLEVYLRTGRRASEMYQEQQEAKITNVNTTQDGQPAGLRFPTLLLWQYCDNDTLRARLDKRVDDMLDAGLLDEVKTLNSFYRSQLTSGSTVDRTRGIWVSIGYKEFQAYEAAVLSGQIGEKELQKLQRQAIEATQAATRQYAKRQIRWIRIKLLNALRTHNATGSMFLLDGSHLSHWSDNVQCLARRLVGEFLTGSEMPDPKTTSQAAAENLTPTRDDMSHRRDLWQRRECEACNAVFVTESSWTTHVKSKGHRYHLRRLQIEAEQKTKGVSVVEQFP